MTITSMYITGDAKLWWCTRVDDNINAGHFPITTWDVLNKELKERFLPCNVARESLRKIEHMGSIRDCEAIFITVVEHQEHAQR